MTQGNFYALGVLMSMVALTPVKVYYNELYALIALISILVVTVILSLTCKFKEDQYFDWSVFYVGALAYNFENIMELLIGRTLSYFLIIAALNSLLALFLTYIIYWNKPSKKKLISEY